jgi:Icc-related predicted phosphoesterase
LKIVAISDTHALHRSLTIPDGDILVHAGDITRQGDPREVDDFNDFLGQLPHRDKIIIAGNHDFCFERDPGRTASLITNGIYLMDRSVSVQGLRFYGSPWQPWFYDWAFNLQRGPEIRAKWDLIPDGTDVLVTHGPPLGHGDRTFRGEPVGCGDLLDAVSRVRPLVHIFGHIHEGAGVTRNERTTFINASSCDLMYAPVNPPIVHEIEP